MTVDKATTWLVTAAFAVLAVAAIIACVMAVLEAVPCLLLGRCA